jgi:hypothetical protein
MTPTPQDKTAALDKIMMRVCEVEQPDLEHPDTLVVSYDDLRLIIEEEIRAALLQPAWQGIDINHIEVGDTVKFRDGKTGKVDSIVAKVFDGIDHSVDDKYLAQARIFISTDSGGLRCYTYRKDGIADMDASADIVEILPPPPTDIDSGEG